MNAPNAADGPIVSDSVAGTVPDTSVIPTLGFGVMRPNRPAVSPFGPAVKYRWSTAPLAALPLPNCSAHRPPMNSGRPSIPSSVPLGVHVPLAFSWNALMRPSPKLPISRSPPYVPKFGCASAVPHGAFRTPPGLAMRARKVPLRSKALTTPSPAPGSSRMPAGALRAYVTMIRLPTVWIP